MKKYYLLLCLLVSCVQLLSAQSLAEKTKGLQKFSGFFPFYWDEKGGRILLEIDKLDQEVLYVSSLPNGVGSNDLGLDRGQIGQTRIVKFVRSGPKILLLQPNYKFRALSDNADERNSVEQAFAQSVVWGFKAEAQEGNRVLIDLTPFLLRDSHQIGDKLEALNQGSFRAEETRSAVFMPNTKSFPQNTEFEAVITLVGKAKGREISSVTPDPNAVTVHMHHSLIQLPDAQYQPRAFDPRAGYYAHEYMDYATPINQPIMKRHLVRHRLQKKDPNAAVSDPVEPLVYYLDRGAPEPVRSALLEGAAWWNQAFEAAGYRNAFQVKLLPEGADPMDIRYNLIQWVHRSTRGWSYGSSIVDPRTGEIIKGQVSLGSLRVRQDFLIAEGLLQPYEDGKPTSSEMLQMGVARLRQLAAHEVGHTLGLYHNYSASTKERSSVMDYPMPRIKLRPDGTIDLSDAYAVGIGNWDKRAILYGYQDFGPQTNEAAGLKAIMNETLKDGYVFMADADARAVGSAHPAAHLWDDGANAAAELNRLMDVRRKLLAGFSEKALAPGQPMAMLEEVLVPIYLLQRYQVEAASKEIGGLYYTYAVKGDGQTITQFVEPAEQWKAFEALMRTISPRELVFSEELLAKIPPRPINYGRSRETFPTRTGLTFDPLGAAESAAATTLELLLNPQRAARLEEYHARQTAQPGLAAVLDKLLQRTWHSKPETGYVGQLQLLVNTLTLQKLLALAAAPTAPANVRALTALKVDELKTWLQKEEKRTKDEARKATLFAALRTISQFEAAPEKFQPEPALPMPDGAPIGDTGCEGF
ncbi:zinc-dependent metalloprotease [Hymenobacter sp. BT186]|uniref:Zinc-dependent metalloprotease n=1 Tax=Hymenobacter telluris TaxID=2816474 RepID=A0A939JCT6_9BACT|nr:zinc-dependent metalloprotease [Hymenobacter telluris]MBO0358705.1 zinc-dependent metalloprotease [Hymenobacter telluris]MBW3374731.1 zinc-dependent metalloprotease [Hymenobacter norwichensis]